VASGSVIPPQQPRGKIVGIELWSPRREWGSPGGRERQRLGMSGEEETDSEEDDEMDWMILDFF
jgi:hypothetical protein